MNRMQINAVAFGFSSISNNNDCFNFGPYFNGSPYYYRGFCDRVVSQWIWRNRNNNRIFGK